jgi:hypothetical protein
MLASIAEKRREIEALCRMHRAKNLALFGSAVRDDFDPAQSDYDFLVEFESLPLGERARRFFGLEADLKALFDRPVDLGEPDGIRNPILCRAIERTRVPVYAAA